jgi:hypothetical protein
VTSYVRKELAADVSVPVSTTTILASQSVTMPASGCPCRAQVSWNLNFTTTTAGVYTAGISDGTNNFAVAQTNETGGALSGAGIAGSGWSHLTYANNQVVSFDFQTRSNDHGYTATKVMNNLVQNSGMDIVIFGSN